MHHAEGGAQRPARPEEGEVGATLLVILPALDEAATIQDVIARIPRSIAGVDRVDVLVVDDGSTDDTAALARACGADVLSHRHNRGVGAAIQTGIAEAIRRRADIAVNMDADGQFDPADIVKLTTPVLSGEADMATASRFKREALVPRMPALKRWGNRGMSWLVSKLTDGSYADVSCGFRAYSREAMLRLTLTGSFTYTQESFLVLAAKGLRIVEVPMAVRGVREHGKSRVASNLWRYALRTSSIIFGSVRDYSAGAFFGTASLALVVTSLGFAAFFFGHYVIAGQFRPHIWAGFVAAFLFSFGMLVFALGQVAVMVSRLRRLQEEQLYFLRALHSELEAARSKPRLSAAEEGERPAGDPPEARAPERGHEVTEGS
jgi:glycosyltransferase involved in cell wall biosynthesis